MIRAHGSSACSKGLMDYGDYVIHVFTDKARAYYDLERLWREAKEVAVPAA